MTVKPKEKRDWFDYAGSLALPVVISIGGILYSWHKDSTDEKRQVAERAEQLEREDRDRDASYLKSMTSENPREQAYGLLMIRSLIEQKKFPPDLLPVMTQMSQGRPTDPATQTAGQFVAGSAAQKLAAAPVGPARNAPVTVYIQYAKDCQSQQALALRNTLTQQAFVTPAAEFVPVGKGGTVHTYVRFFDPSNADVARSINNTLNALKLNSAVQDFSKAFPALNRIEVWLGENQGATLMTNDHRDTLGVSPGVALSAC